jgi:hypothetical protein
MVKTVKMLNGEAREIEAYVDKLEKGEKEL